MLEMEPGGNSIFVPTTPVTANGGLGGVLGDGSPQQHGSGAAKILEPEMVAQVVQVQILLVSRWRWEQVILESWFKCLGGTSEMVELRSRFYFWWKWESPV